ncbi:MAG: hypothetical protein LC644_02205, partial [Pseudonocardia sp.]|nr:hypothetical protein [Pseudonocardia sp.]
VMKLVPVMIAPAVVTISTMPNAAGLGVGIVVLAAAVIVVGVVVSKRRSTSLVDASPAPQVTARRGAA